MTRLHIHLDPVGGIAGDMFVAALLDTWPEHAEKAISAVRDAGLGTDIDLSHLNHNDGILTGSRFEVSRHATKAGSGKPEHPDQQGHHTHHHHTHWAEIRRSLEESHLAPKVAGHAIGIFAELAAAEAKVHGTDIDSVAFHEVGNWDSIADIVAAAALIELTGALSWSIGSLPIGSGRVTTAHGDLPVPAPATTLLLEGFAQHDDGRPGERVTPTGAAILRYLKPDTDIGQKPRILGRSGFGFGKRRLEGMSNVLRVLAFDSPPASRAEQDAVGVIQFEIDDQTGEELAVSLDHIREQAGVIDVVQTPMFGKKGRMLAGIQVLTAPDRLDEVARSCFLQTTTLGLRMRVDSRSILKRREVKDPNGLRIKIADRPGGRTAKTDIDEVAGTEAGHLTRRMRRQGAEQAALLRSDENA